MTGETISDIFVVTVIFAITIVTLWFWRGTK